MENAGSFCVSAQEFVLRHKEERLGMRTATKNEKGTRRVAEVQTLERACITSFCKENAKVGVTKTKWDNRAHNRIIKKWNQRGVKEE